MSIKWADYLISKVRYDDSHNYINDLFIHKNTGGNIREVGAKEPSLWFSFSLFP